MVRLLTLHRRQQLEKYFAERAGKLMEQLAEVCPQCCARMQAPCESLTFCGASPCLPLRPPAR